MVTHRSSDHHLSYDSWKLMLISELISSWPQLKEFTVRHIPDNSYHLLPDEVAKPPKKTPYTLPAHNAHLTTLSLRETYIDDNGLFHLLHGSALTSLCLMSCQGITSSAITRQGLLEAIRTCGPILRDLRIMVPWLPYSAEPDEPDMVIDRALSFCTSLRSLCVAGYDVSNSFTRAIPNPHLLRSLEIMDFELVTPLSVFQVASTKTDRPFSSLEKLAIWQRNAGVGRARVSNGWFKAVFGKETSPAIKALERANILLATGWESRLISGSDIEYHHPRLAASAFEELDKLSPV
ncbi:MAG: hypothetical protein CYPHOPRED_004820 [Cyphobasidiales sp. Tagirdzhanova-0007]|nr:MAG: hypothetical protein CYPHOPRED_004820 [Cyphobasidiales sp. Tagirdzhanova-0007]